MIFEICAIGAVVIFAFLAIYIIQTLRTLQMTLKGLHHLTLNLEDKSRKIESTINTISTLGDVCEEKMRALYERDLKQRERECKKSDYSADLADLIVASLKLTTKFLRR